MALLLEGLAKDRSADALTVHHVNARFSDDISSIARLQPKKLFRLAAFCAQAIWFRFRYESKVFIYVPAPGLRAPIYRDWLIMLLCRPFYPKRVYNWQAAGLGEWLKKDATKVEIWLTRLLLARPDQSILAGKSSLNDATALDSRRVALVPNAIKDPCPDFDTLVLPVRLARLSRRTSELTNSLSKSPTENASFAWFEVLYLSLCTREKGLFNAMDAIDVLNTRLAEGKSAIRARLTVAGKFYLEEEEKEFRQKAQRLNFSAEFIRYVGFADPILKQTLFSNSDCFCFPTFYPAETFGLVLLEAMAWGLPIVTTNWRGVSDVLPDSYEGLVPPDDPNSLSLALEKCIGNWNGIELRTHCKKYFKPANLISSFKRLLNDLSKA